MENDDLGGGLKDINLLVVVRLIYVTYSSLCNDILKILNVTY